MADETYEPRYCAFIDILGFSQLVNRLGAGETPFIFLKNLLSKVHNPPQVQSGLLTYALTEFRVQSISDAVAISTKPTASGLLQIFQSLTQLTVDLLSEGYFIRGAIVKGALYHDDKMVFGDALVMAYHLEQEIVRYPRIMVSTDVLTEAISDEHLGTFVRESVRQAEDGPYYLHTLKDLETFLQTNRSLPAKDSLAEKSLGQWTAIQTHIEQRFGEAADVPRHFEKVQWFANYWNDVIEPIGSQIYMRITGPGLHYPMPITWDTRI